MNQDVAVSARGIHKTYGSGSLAFHALKGVDFEVGLGELVMLAGPSGSGKTTLLSILGCVLAPTGGELRLFGEDVSRRREAELPDLRLGRLGFVFQGHNLLASLSARENVALPLAMRGAPRRTALAEADALLARVGLQGKEFASPAALSGGQRQRVAIARALVARPQLVLADEPTAALDAESGLLVSALLRELSRERGTTVVVVTHDSRIFHLADRIVHIEDGLVASREPRAEPAVAHV